MQRERELELVGRALLSCQDGAQTMHSAVAAYKIAYLKGMKTAIVDSDSMAVRQMEATPCNKRT